jgi:hypothetical protein
MSFKRRKTKKIITKYECRVKYLPTAGANPIVYYTTEVHTTASTME